MATVPSAKDWSDNTVPTAAEFNSNIKDAVNFFKAPPRVIAKHNATITRPNRTSWSVIPWNQTVTDTDNMHDDSINNSWLISNTAGRYHVWCAITWEDHLVQPFEGDRGLMVRKNSSDSPAGGTLVAVDHRHCNTNPNNEQVASNQGCDGFAFLGVGDYVQAFAYDADDDTIGFPSTDVGCYLEPARYASARFGMTWISA